MSDTPDTSNANVARVLRCIAKACPSAQVDCTDRLWSIREACTVAADALERQEDVTSRCVERESRDSEYPVSPSPQELASAARCERIRSVRQEDVTWSERVEAAGLRMMPTAWPAMTPKERQVYIDRWEPIARAFFPEFAPPTED